MNTFEIGNEIRIEEMKGEPDYNMRTGIIESIDDTGQLHGTWGGVALDLMNDKIHLLSDEHQGLCAKCLSDNITYGSSYPVDSQFCYQWECEECKTTGNEMYNLKFVEHVI